MKKCSKCKVNFDNGSCPKCENLYKPGDVVVCTTPLNNVVAGGYYVVEKSLGPSTKLVGIKEPVPSSALIEDVTCIKTNKEQPQIAATLGGKKMDQDKAPIDLIPVSAIMGMALVFGFGGKKYGRHNFREGFEHTRAINAALRHILAIVGGEDTDPESGHPHVYHALCSLAMYDFLRLNLPELDDRYKGKK